MQSQISINFDDLVRAFFLVRPNRFIVRCHLESGEEVEAHLGDPGRLKELLLPGSTLYLRFVDNPLRKTKWSASLALSPDGETLVSLQPTLANLLAAKALENSAIESLSDWAILRPEYTYGSSRYDFLLENPQGQQLLLEVKSCTLVEDGVAMFPDAVTERGRRHVQELTKLQISGEFQTAVLFVVQRADGERFSAAKHIDPAFAEALENAYNQGVKIIVYNSVVGVKGIMWGRELPLEFS